MTHPLSPNPASPKTAEDANRLRWPDFPHTISRPMEGMEEQEVMIEVTYFRPPGNNRGLDHRDPAYDGGEVCFGDAFLVPNGMPIVLSPLEEEAAETRFWNELMDR